MAPAATPAVIISVSMFSCFGAWRSLTSSLRLTAQLLPTSLALINLHTEYKRNTSWADAGNVTGSRTLATSLLCNILKAEYGTVQQNDSVKPGRYIRETLQVRVFITSYYFTSLLPQSHCIAATHVGLKV